MRELWQLRAAALLVVVVVCSRCGAREGAAKRRIGWGERFSSVGGLRGCGP